jgi:hypothetical protein
MEKIDKEITPSQEQETSDAVVGNSKKESYDFSKEFSKHGREKMAEQVRLLRHEYMIEIPEKNAKLTEKRELLTEQKEKAEQEFEQKKQTLSDVEIKRNDWLSAQEELKKISEGIEKRKASLWYKIQRRFGGGNDVREKEKKYWNKKNEVGYFDEGELHRAQISENAKSMHDSLIESYNREILEAENIVIDEAWHDKARAMVNEFYRGQGEIKNEWENDGDEREIQFNTEKHNALFLHGIPFESEMANTSMNNSLIDTETMSPEDKALSFAGLNPTVSVSTKTLDSVVAEKMPKQELMYDTGFILVNGKIMSAFDEDAGTVAEDLDIKYSKYKDTTSSVQPEIDEHIAKAVGYSDERRRHATGGHNWNEFVVKEPQIGAMYITENARRQEEAISRMMKIAEEIHVPLIRIFRDGKLFNITENRETTKEEVLAHATNFSVEEKIGFIEQTKKFVNKDTHPEMAEEIQKRLDTLKAEKTKEEQKEEDSQKEQEVRAKIKSTFETK